MNDEIYHLKIFLPYGDYYTGYWVDNLPNGQAKYQWIDCFMYVGDWNKGKMKEKQSGSQAQIKERIHSFEQ